MERISVNVTLHSGYHKLVSVIWLAQLMSITAMSPYKGKILEILLTSQKFFQNGEHQNAPLGKEISRGRFVIWQKYRLMTGTMH